MQGEDNYVITISNTEAEVIKKFVSIIDNATAVSYTHLTLPTKA